MATTVITDETVTIALRMGATLTLAVIDDGTAEAVYTLPGQSETTDEVDTLPAVVYGPYPFGVSFEITAVNSVQADTSAVTQTSEAIIQQVESLPTSGERGTIYQTVDASYWWNGAAFVSMGGGSGTFTNLTVSGDLMIGDDATVTDDLTVGGNVLLANGTALLPALTFTSDVNTGMFRNAADEIGMTAGGATVALFTAGYNASAVPFYAQNTVYLGAPAGAGTEGLHVPLVASAANHITASGAITTEAPFLAAEGTDTDIDLALTPKGAGLVSFGVATASVATASTHQIGIKAADGTTYYLLATTVA